jgi:hypothetical protein
VAACPYCHREMLCAVSCNTDPFVIAGKLYEPVPWGEERRFGRRAGPFGCRDCATPPGGIHHHGCDVEECPACHGQAISCGCDDRGEWDHLPHHSQARCTARSRRETM